MPRNLSTGVFTRVSNSFSQPVYGTVIDPTDAGDLFDDYDAGLTFNDTSPLILVGSTSGVLTILAPDAASGTITLPAGTTDFSGTGGTGQFVKQATAGAPFTVSTVDSSEIANPEAITKTDDTNVTLTLGGTPASAVLKATSLTLGWTGTLAAGRLNSNVVQSVVNDTNVTGSISAQALTLGWTGTLAAGRLNSNVVQSVVNDTNVTGSISAQALTLGWTGTLANSRLANMAAYTIKGNATSSAAAPQDFTIAGLTHKATPSSSDLILISDVSASDALKYSTLSEAIAAVSPGVTSINGLTGALTGILTNTRLAKTAAYAVTNSDDGKTIALGGNGYYPLTLDNPSGFDANFSINVVNEDTGRGKLLLPFYTSSSTSLAIGTGSKAFTVSAGLTFPVGSRFRAYSLANSANFMSGSVSYSGTTLTLTVDTVGGSGTLTDWQIAPEKILWPNQTVTILNDNNVWVLDNPNQLWMPNSSNTSSNITLYVDGTDGSNSNDGLATTTGALKTLSRAVAVAYRYIYTRNIGSIVIDGGGLTYQEFLNVFYPLNGGGTIIFQNLTWKPANSSYCLQFGDGALVGLTSVAFSSAGTTGPKGFVYGHNHGVLDVNTGVTITPTVTLSGSVFDADFDTHFNINNGLTLNAGSVTGFLYRGQGPRTVWNINGAHVYSGTPTFGRFLWCSQASVMQFQGNVTHSGAVTTSVGLINQNGVVQNLGGSLPGGAITPTTGGQYNTTTTA